ncbi:glycoside hydrolase family protein [Cellulomonas sp. URHD0024]|uniref:glycoside hydrolase family protein n=1 Tax=Cellulomonas sp. URHD0024 TaxID=1302620 RepID=UPI000422FC82|nr:glycoside hydrolase family protein [Cellulomonas sp. URHD0024]
MLPAWTMSRRRLIALLAAFLLLGVGAGLVLVPRSSAAPEAASTGHRGSDTSPLRASSASTPAATASSAPQTTPPPPTTPAATGTVPTPTAGTPTTVVKPPAAPPKAAPAPPRAAPRPPATHTAKKGVATWEFTGATAALKDVGVGWYYNWSTSNASMPAPSGVEFVPMIWGASNVTPAALGAPGSTLLGFNEPDMGGQANMTVDRALELWPQLQATGKRLGSPAVAWGGDRAGGWLDQFMSGAKARGLRVDFITLHWYGSDFGPDAVDQLQRYVAGVHARYGLPIWVTEYSLINFSGSPKFPTDDQMTAFIASSTAMFESTPYVERYAWFGLPALEPGTGLYRDGSTPTPAGVAYRAAG